MAERFIHFSARPLTRVESTNQADGFGVEPFFKPRGLWFSVEGNDDGWKSWCEAEKFRLPALTHQTEIVFTDHARLLRLSTVEHIDTFTEEYVLHYPALGMRRGFVLDWAKLAERHDAIVIAPYQYERRMSDHTMWYYSWDCASGCVWNAAAVKELVPQTVPA